MKLVALKIQAQRKIEARLFRDLQQEIDLRVLADKLHREMRRRVLNRDEESSQLFSID